MNDNWLEISDDQIDAGEIRQRIQARLAGRRHDPTAHSMEDAEAIARDLWQEMIGDATAEGDLEHPLSLRPRDGDIVPRTYVIDWRTPILGPIHAVVRRLINAEIRRYLFPSLEKQSHFNRQVLRQLADLRAETERLRQEIDQLRGTRE